MLMLNTLTLSVSRIHRKQNREHVSSNKTKLVPVFQQYICIGFIKNKVN